VSITVPRLVTPAIELVAPADTPTITFPDLPDGALALPRVPTKPPATTGCPTADPLAQPEVPATLEVTSPPAAGTAVQVMAGAYSTAQGQGALLGLVQQTVEQLPSARASSGQLVDTWRVERTDAARKSRFVEVYQLVHPSTAVGATNAGIWLVGLAFDDPLLGKLTFSASGGGVQVLPSPVQVAQNDTQYAGAATDPSNLTTLSIVRNVRARERVDACGSLIDTWTVEMTGVITTTSTQRAFTWKQQLATGYGAADVQDTFSVTAPLDNTTFTRTLRNVALPKEVTA
jgi:hypothetical protein